MATKIEWTNETWNPVTGCSPISPGCDHCYAARMATRLAGRCGYPAAPDQFRVTMHPERLLEPLRWRKPRRVFVCSMGDLFHEDVSDKNIDHVFWAMDQSAAKWENTGFGGHTFQILTKRPERMLERVTAWQDGNRLAGVYDYLYPHLWLGVTAEDQQRADERIPLLLQTPAAVRFVSCEPLLGPVKFSGYELSASAQANPAGPPSYNKHDYLTGYVGLVDHKLKGAGYHGPKLDWVIVGGETGPGARPMNPDWARSLRDECKAAGVPFFYKKGQLDGVTYHEYPAAEANNGK